VCAGSGIAPFRGFLQDRALQSADSGVAPGPALLFFGCDDADTDYLYRDELETWAADGIVELHPAFSQAGDGVPYVQDRLWQDRARVAEVFRDGAVVYVCGDGHRMAPAVHDMCVRIYRDVAGCGEGEAQAWLDRMAREQSRYLTDVFE
jgi:cytochrome P450/NADPH-cytochrome P450 reductase